MKSTPKVQMPETTSEKVQHISEEASTVKRKRKSTSKNVGKRRKAFSGENSSNSEGLQNVTTENMLKATYSNISDKTREMKEEAKQGKNVEQSRERNTTKGQHFLMAAEENAAKMEITKTVDESLNKERKRNVELQADGSSDEMIEIHETASLVENEVKSEILDLQYISMNWAENDGLLDAYFDECDLINHIPISKSIDELVQFLITKRNESQE